MKILFGQGSPVPLRRHLHPHAVDTAFERGWSTLTNGDLLSVAIEDKYDVLVTTDQNLKNQQNLMNLYIGIVVLLSTSWPRIRNKISDICVAIDSVAGGGLVEVSV